MTIARKVYFGPSEFKALSDGSGKFRARIATLNVVDKEGDVTLSGAFPVGKEIVISAYQHTSWKGELPVGKGTLGADSHTAWVDGEFFNTTAGRDTYETVKALAESGQGEWSYGFDVLDSSVDYNDLEAFPGSKRILKKLDVFEASPVLVGAGVDTQTLSIKSYEGTTANAVRELAQSLKAQAVDSSALAIVQQIDELADQLDELVDSLLDDLSLPDPDEEGEPEEGKAFMAAIKENLELSDMRLVRLACIEIGAKHGIGYIEVPSREIDDDQMKLAGKVLLYSMADLGLKGPIAVKWFREVLPHETSTFKSLTPLAGRAVGSTEIWLNEVVTNEDLLATTAHEVAHIAQAAKGMPMSVEDREIHADVYEERTRFKAASRTAA